MTLPAENRPLRVLFVKDEFHWPRASGGDIHGSQMARALAARGHAVDAATFAPSDPKAVDDLGLNRVLDLTGFPPSANEVPRPGLLQRRLGLPWHAHRGFIPRAHLRPP